MEATQTAQKQFKTCLVTLVTPGSSDKVMKVYPAEHEAEKIWLDNAQGEQRWAQVERLLNNYVPRDKAVMKPVPYCSGDLARPTLRAEDIPLNTLEGGAVLKAPPPSEMLPETAVKLNPNIENLQSRMNKMEGTMDKILELLSAKAPVQEPEVSLPAVDEKYGETCSHCGKKVMNAHLLKMHIGRFHKYKK